MTYSCFIFDLDGTLSDPLVGMAAALNAALLEHGYAECEPATLGQYVGPPLEGTLETLTGNKDPAHIMSLVQAYRDYYISEGFTQNSLYTDIPTLLQQLDQRDCRLGVCTSKPQSTANKILRHFELDTYFTFVSGGDIGVTKSYQLESLLQTQQIDNQALMIGDRHVDVVAAKANGLASAGVLWGYGSLTELEQHSPEHVVEQPLELLEVLPTAA